MGLDKDKAGQLGAGHSPSPHTGGKTTPTSPDPHGAALLALAGASPLGDQYEKWRRADVNLQERGVGSRAF